MKRFVLAPDSFKGTMSAVRICDIMEESIKNRFPDAQAAKVPVADGGEGTMDCFKQAMGGERVAVTVTGPHFEPVQTSYLRLPDGVTAVIEMASAAGLPLAGGELNPETATTYGVGELIRRAGESGCRRVILGLGGSATNDGGAGMAAALGVRFLDADGKPFVPVGGTLDRIAKIEAGHCAEFLPKLKITAMCDVTNLLTGPAGAAFVFGPQKGADQEMAERLDKKLDFFAKKIREAGGPDVTKIPGGGAAGGMGAGAACFLNAELKSGIETVLDTVGFDRLLDSADFVLTGEGRLDGQSLHGKVISGVARRAKNKKVPVIALVGDIGDDIGGIYGMGVSAVLSINRKAIPFSQARSRCEKDLGATVDTLMRLIAL